MSIESTETPEVIAAVTDSTFEAMYLSEKAENARLKDVLTAARLNPDHVAKNRDVQPAKLAKQVEAQLGPLALHNMTREQKLQALGIVDTSVTDDLLRKIFGRSNDGSVGKDLMLSNPGRYRQLREAALLLRVYGR